MYLSLQRTFTGWAAFPRRAACHTPLLVQIVFDLGLILLERRSASRTSLPSRLVLKPVLPLLGLLGCLKL